LHGFILTMDILSSKRFSCHFLLSLLVLNGSEVKMDLHWLLIFGIVLGSILVKGILHEEWAKCGNISINFVVGTLKPYCKVQTILVNDVKENRQVY